MHWSWLTFGMLLNIAVFLWNARGFWRIRAIVLRIDEARHFAKQFGSPAAGGLDAHALGLRKVLRMLMLILVGHALFMISLIIAIRAATP